MNYREKVLEDRNIEITTDWNGGGYDWEVGTEDTVDGYTLHYAKLREDAIWIAENVFYDEYDFTEHLQGIIEEESDIKILFWDDEILEEIDWELIYDNLNIEEEEEEEPFLKM
tara:strand:- start:934 stop:1272 length:339 start_codon:yes stop_codon:yes gene_type:complete